MSDLAGTFSIPERAFSTIPVISRAVTLACAYALVGWAFFTGLLVALGNVLLPSISRPLTPLVVVGLAALTAVAVAGLSLDFFRRVERDDVSVALTLGICLASIGLTLDAVLLLATRFRYPNVDEEKDCDARRPAAARLCGRGSRAAARGLAEKASQRARSKRVSVPLS